jgi:saccharopine dehydrogenase-like protein
MSDPTAISGTVHWVGAGLSTGSGLVTLAGQADRLVLWARTPARADDVLDRLGVTGGVTVPAFTAEKLRAAVKPGDIVVSMVPAFMHAGLITLCRDAGAHFACTSYLSPEVEAAAAGASTVVLTEAGLDPGIDHLAAHLLVSRARAAVEGPATVRFTSYCGGLPAVPNDFRYQFSWAPAGVLTALLSPARYLEDGSVRVAPEPWKATRPRQLGDDTFETYPNRDSLPFVDQYRIPAQWCPETFVRGTARLPGWYDAWQPVFTELAGGDRARITALAEELAARYQMGADDRDRVVLAVNLEATGQDGTEWSGSYVLDLLGTAQETAMARCVSETVAVGVSEILAGRVGPGLHRAASQPEEAQRWLDALDQRGVSCAPTRTKEVVSS